MVSGEGQEDVPGSWIRGIMEILEFGGGIWYNVIFDRDIQKLGFRVQGLGFRVPGSGFRVRIFKM